MIKYSELRPGNLIKTPDGIQSVTGIMRGKQVVVIYWGYEKHCASHLCQPIPISEEWLIKLGFAKSKSPFSDGIYEGPIIDHRVEYNSGTYMYCLWSDHLKDVMYVHEFQNLYHALTGEELKITLT